jgi:hypothetical protein
MTACRTLCVTLALAAIAGIGFGGMTAATPPPVAFRHEPGVLHIDIGGRLFADYIYADQQITRPHFAHVHTPAGIRVTRNHPPEAGKDLMDHAKMHPGIWMAFGDLSQNDYWRLKAKVEHEMFITPPEGGSGKGRFAVRNYYLRSGTADRIAAEEASYTILAIPEGYLLIWDSTFAPYGETQSIAFGDQEEMGLGFRLQSRLAEQFGGVMTDSEGRAGAKQIWGTQADWLDYSGTLDGKWIGITVMPDPANFRRSWYHARDYGFTAANPFGREAMKAGPKSEVVVKKGDKLRLRYGVLVHSGNKKGEPSVAAAYKRFLDTLTAAPR